MTKTAVVTGASRGIGRSIAIQCNLCSQQTVIEQELRQLPIPITFLRPAWFMENLRWGINPFINKYTLDSFLQPFDKPVPMVATADIGQLPAELLQQPITNHQVVGVIFENGLPETEQGLRQIIDGIPAFIIIFTAQGQVEFVSRQTLECVGKTFDELKGLTGDTFHPDDIPRLMDIWDQSFRTGQGWDIEHRIRRADSAYRWFRSSCIAQRGTDGRIVRWYNLLTDIDEQRRVQEDLRKSEENFRMIVDGIDGHVTIMNAEFVNNKGLEYFGKTLEELKAWATIDAVHPDDLPQAVAAWRRSVETGQPYDIDHRLRRFDGEYRWFHARGLSLRDAQDRIVRWYVLLTDIEDRKRAEDRLHLLLNLNNRVGSHLDLRAVFQAISSELRRVFKCDFVGLVLPDGSGKYLRQHMMDFPGSSTDLFKEGTLFPLEGSASGRAFNNAKPVILNNWSEGRSIWMSNPAFYKRVADEARFKSGYFSGYFFPLISGDRTLGVLQMTRFDEHSVDEQEVEFLCQVANHIAIPVKNALEYEQVSEIKDRLYDQNLALREQIDKEFMFEEIVGSSPILQAVLTSVVKVAPTDSTVLILGETGTGKELIARAIHKRSRRSGQAFISVNCASIPSSLIASELFGHEKGAFTGALQQRQGRFEQARSGTIFLDEIGELPAETQIALLRVLQERQFERVGGNRVIPADVRIIAATNRDLSAAITAGTFRADLFYRLNVFPIQMPALRKRKDDIPMLVEYFVQRFAEKMGKHIREIDKTTMEVCQKYHWPGNVRELQNIVERSVILCSGDTFWIDEACLSIQEPSGQDLSGPLTETLKNEEKKIIEAALAQSKGKIAGSNGAAAKLGIPPSTLESKIKQFKIKKHEFSGSC
jgi:formate hydrogenlyase transcriptional activator